MYQLEKRNEKFLKQDQNNGTTTEEKTVLRIQGISSTTTA